MRWFLAGIATAAAGLAIWTVRKAQQTDEPALPSSVVPASALPNGSGAEGVAPRDVDPAGMGRTEWSSDPERVDEFRALVETTIDVKDLLRMEGRKWAETRLALEDPFLRDEEDARCRATFGRPVDVEGIRCSFTLDAVVSPDGQVVYARATLDPSEDQACDPLAGCIASTRLGRHVPLPGETSAELALSQRVVIRPVPANMSDPVFLTKMIAAMDADITAAREKLGMDATEDGEQYYRYRMAQRMLDYLKGRATDLNGAGDGE
jgi:hypothetical protein